MLTPEESELLTRTGSGTAMGDLFRRYWVPALLPEELPAPDCKPARANLMTEPLVAFKDTGGQLGLLAAACPHRGADLSYGHSEEFGLRCGMCWWKFDLDGNCLEIPLEPEETRLRRQIHHTAYPLREQGGLLWAYLGPSDVTPQMPELEWTALPEAHRYASKCVIECNYLQAVEGGIDLGRVTFMESLLDREGDIPKPAGGGEWPDDDDSHEVMARDTDYGLLIGTSRDEAGGERTRWQVTQWLMPFYATVLAAPGGLPGWMAWAPIDDEHTMVYAVSYHPQRPLSAEELENCREGRGIHPQVEPGSYRRRRNKSNFYLIDRTRDRTNPLTGIASLVERGMAIQESMGPIVDRTNEHLGPNDVAVMAARRRLMRAAIDLREGGEPFTAHHGEAYRVRPWAGSVRRGVAFDEDSEVKRATTL